MQWCLVLWCLGPLGSAFRSAGKGSSPPLHSPPLLHMPCVANAATLALLLVACTVPLCVAEQTPRATATPVPAAAARSYRVAIFDEDGDVAATAAAFRPLFEGYVAQQLARLSTSENFTLHVAAVPAAAAGTLRNVDFVMAGAEPIATLLRDHRFGMLASVERFRLGRGVSRFGGVVLTHNTSGVATPDACLAGENATIAVASTDSFGGFLAQARLLQRSGVAPSALQSHPGLVVVGSYGAVVAAVANRSARCGFVRSDALEAAAQRAPGPTANVCVVGQRNDTEALLYPFALSTKLYPDWGLVAHARVPSAAVDVLEQILASIDPHDHAVLGANCSRFLPALGYTCVQSVLVATGRLADPGAASSTSAETASSKAVVPVLVTVSLIAVLLLVTVVLMCCVNRRPPTVHAPTDAALPFAAVVVDVQSGPALWARMPQFMGAAVDAYVGITRDLIDRHRGYETKQVGDSFVVVFQSATDAVAFSVALQRALFRHDWDCTELEAAYVDVAAQRSYAAVAVTGRSQRGSGACWNGLRARVAIDFGAGDIAHDEVRDVYDYRGPVVHSAVRLEAAAHGGQIVATRRALDATDPAAVRSLGVAVEALGQVHLLPTDEHREALVQLVPTELSSRNFPPLGNLSWHQTPDGRDGKQNVLQTPTTLIVDMAYMFAIRHSARDPEAGYNTLMHNFCFLKALLAPCGAAPERNVLLGRLMQLWRIGGGPTTNNSTGANAPLELTDEHVMMLAAKCTPAGVHQGDKLPPFAPSQRSQLAGLDGSDPTKTESTAPPFVGSAPGSADAFQMWANGSPAASHRPTHTLTVSSRGQSSQGTNMSAPPRLVDLRADPAAASASSHDGSVIIDGNFSGVVVPDV